MLQILASIGKYDLFRMIVMIFVTKNDNFNNPEISDRLLGYYYLNVCGSGSNATNCVDLLA